MSETPERSTMRVSTPPTLLLREGAYPSMPGSPLNSVYDHISSQQFHTDLIPLEKVLSEIKGNIVFYNTYKSFIPPDAPAASLIENIDEYMLEICGNDTGSGAPRAPTRLTFSDGAGGGKSKKRKSKKRKTKKKSKKRKTNKRKSKRR